MIGAVSLLFRATPGAGRRHDLAAHLPAPVIPFLLLLLLAGCTPRGSSLPPAGAGDDGLTGIASWYGGRFHGRRTANGEIYDMNALTAAHRTLPFGTIVEVTNLGNGRKVRLRINDRGPFIKGRIIDVSRRAAKELGFLIDGTAPVRLRIVTPD